MSDPSDPNYWRERYRSRQTGWDLGAANAGLLAAATVYFRPEDRILIPGAGRGYEAEALWRRGYRDVFVCDWAEEAFVTLRRSPSLPAPDRLIVGDFFALTGTYDGLLEQTFFCAIDPARRREYVVQCARLLQPEGRWVGVLFDRPFEGGPPFGGTRAEYRALFGESFDVEALGRFDGSIAPRRGTELLGVMQAKRQA